MRTTPKPTIGIATSDERCGFSPSRAQASTPTSTTCVLPSTVASPAPTSSIALCQRIRSAAKNAPVDADTGDNRKRIPENEIPTAATSTASTGLWPTRRKSTRKTLTEPGGDGLRQRLCLHHRELAPTALRRLSGRDHRLEPELRALLEPTVRLRRRTQTSRQPDLAEHGQPFTCRYTLRGGGNRQRDGEIRARLVDPDAPSNVHEDIRAAKRDARVPSEHGDDHREPLRVDTGRDSPRHRQIARRDERLDLEQDRPRALERARDGRADLTAGRAAEQLGRIGNSDETCPGHLEDAELVRRAEAVLGRAQDALCVIPVALELQDAVDEVLEHARAGDRAVLRHVADEDRRDAQLLRRAHQAPGGLTHLRDRAGRRPDLRRIQGLHGVD